MHEKKVSQFSGCCFLSSVRCAQAIEVKVILGDGKVGFSLLMHHD